MSRTPRFVLLLAAVVALALAGCSSDSAGSDGSSGSGAETTETSSTDGGSEDDGSSDGSGSASSGSAAEASVDKILAADGSLDRDDARCIVQNMTADGSIGMGEVATMDFGDLAANSDRLQAAYEAALTNCI